MLFAFVGSTLIWAAYREVSRGRLWVRIKGGMAGEAESQAILPPSPDGV
jgi:hypothetical protein